MNTKKQYFGFGNIIKYFFMFCGVTFIYGLIKGLRLFDRGLFVLYLGDFSIGKCSRFLIGSVISIFRDTYTKEWIYSFNLVFLILIFILCGYYISSAAASSKKSNTLPVMIVSAIFIMCPFSFASIYGSRYFGLLDIYEFLVFLLCIMLGKNKYLFYLIPFLCAAGVFIHDSYILVYLCPCLAVCAYYAVKRHKKSIPALTGFGVSSAAGFAASVFVVFFSQSTIKMSEAQVMEYLAAKGQCSVNEVSGYIEQYLFNKNVSSSLDIDYGSDIWEMLKYMADLYAEGLINEDAFTVSSDQFTALSGGQNIVGMFVGYRNTNCLGQSNPDDFVALPVISSPVSEGVVGAVMPTRVGGFAISAECENPAALVRWYDYLNSSLENALLWEIKRFYSQEFELGQYALKMIHEKRELFLVFRSFSAVFRS